MGGGRKRASWARRRAIKKKWEARSFVERSSTEEDEEEEVGTERYV